MSNEFIPMIFTITYRADLERNWKRNACDNFFNLINEFKNKFNLELYSIEKSEEKFIFKNEENYCFILRNYYIYFNTKDSIITLRSNTSKKDFDEKYNFIVEYIKNL